MFKLKRVTIPIAMICLLIFTLFVVGGCGQKQEQAKEELKKEQAKGGTLGAASVGGTFYIWGGALTKIIAEKVKFPMSEQVTGGPVHNVQLVSKGEITLGLLSMPTGYDGWNGIGWAKGEKYQDIRVVLPMYPGFDQFWTLEKSGIKSVNDINGRSINLGPKGGTMDVYGRQELEILGVKPSKIVNTGFDDMVGQMLDGMVDVGFTSGGVPHTAVMQTEASKPIVVFTAAEKPDDAKKLMTKLPSYFTGIIPKDSYKAVTKDLQTLQYWNVLVCRKDLPDDLAYNIVKAYFDNLGDFKEIYKDTINTVPADVTKSVIPIHKGALKYYKEKGVEIPSNLIPPEAK